MCELTIDIHNAEKIYRGKVHALRGVTMQAGAGEIVGLLGPNGAGKSTLVKILMTIVHPSRCGGTMLGRPIGDKRALARVGYLPEHLRFPDYLTGEQALDYLGGLQNVPRAVRRRRAEEAVDLVGMGPWRARKIGGYSKGMKQRLGVAQALMNDPDLIVLDEPTDGVDPVGRRDIRTVLVALKDRGKTVFLNSHLLGEVEMVCDRVSILVQGSVAMQGSLEELTAGGRRYEIRIGPLGSEARARLIEQINRIAKRESGRAREEAPRRGARSTPPTSPIVWCGALSDGPTLDFDGQTFRIGTTVAKEVQPLIDALRSAGTVITTVRLVQPSLEDLFIAAVTDPETGRAREIGADRRSGNGGGR